MTPRIRPRAAGANFSVDVDGVNLAIHPSDARNPRVDLIARTADMVRAVCGVPTINANLMNRLGAPCLPEGHEQIGWVLVHPGACAIRDADIHWWDSALEARFRELEAEVAESALDSDAKAR